MIGLLVADASLVAEVLFNFVSIFIQVLSWSIIIRALLSWFTVSGKWPVVQLLMEITEPVLAPIRRALPSSWMIDLSPLIALILLQVLGRILLPVVGSIA